MQSYDKRKPITRDSLTEQQLGLYDAILRTKASEPIGSLSAYQLVKENTEYQRLADELNSKGFFQNPLTVREVAIASELFRQGLELVGDIAIISGSTPDLPIHDSILRWTSAREGTEDIVTPSSGFEIIVTPDYQSFLSDFFSERSAISGSRAYEPADIYDFITRKEVVNHKLLTLTGVKNLKESPCHSSLADLKELGSLLNEDYISRLISNQNRMLKLVDNRVSPNSEDEAKIYHREEVLMHLENISIKVAEFQEGTLPSYSITEHETIFDYEELYKRAEIELTLKNHDTRIQLAYAFICYVLDSRNALIDSALSDCTPSEIVDRCVNEAKQLGEHWREKADQRGARDEKYFVANAYSKTTSVGNAERRARMYEYLHETLLKNGASLEQYLR